MATQRFALITVLRSNQLLIAEGLPPMAEANLETPPACAIAASSASIATSGAFMPRIYHECEDLSTTNVSEFRGKITGVKTIAERLKLAREQSGLNQQELAKRAGVSQGTIGNIESGLRKQPRGLLEIAKALNVSPQWLSNGNGPMRESNIEPGPDIRGLVPLISWVQAGQWCEAAQPEQQSWGSLAVREPLPTYTNCEQYLPCPVPHSPSTFALRVKGDSMTAPYGRSYPEGCIIFVDPERRNPVNGDRVVACLADSNEVTFKVFKHEDGRRWLHPLNPAHQPLYERFSVLGTVLGKWEDG